MRVCECRIASAATAMCILLLAAAVSTRSQEREVIIRKDLLPAANTSLPAAADSALRCSMGGLNAMGTALLHAPIRSARGNRRLKALLAGLQASMYSELGMVTRAEALYTQHRAELLRLPFAPYGACLRAHMALHHHRMGRRENAFNLITAVVRPLGDEAQCRAVAMGRYHLGVLLCWEGNDAEAVEHFAAAVHTIAESEGNDADAARYWAAYAETLTRLGRVEEADRAWRRAYTHALVDPVSRRRLARQVAIQHADLLIRQGERRRAAECLRAYTPASRDDADVLLAGMQELVEARLAMGERDEDGVRRHLRAALWSLHRALTDDALPLTRQESLLLRRQASDAVDLAFSTLLRDTLRQADLEHAAWDTHLAELGYCPPPLLRGDGAAAMASLSWLEERTRWERRSFAPEMRQEKRPPWAPVSGLRAFAAQLSADCRGIVIRRFMDVRGDGAPCYAAVSVSPRQSVDPRLIWLDRDGTLEKKLIPEFAAAELGRRERSGDRAGACARLWSAIGEPLVGAADARGTLIMIPDGVFSQFDPAVLYDPGRDRHLGDLVDICVAMRIPREGGPAEVRTLQQREDHFILRDDSTLCAAPRFLPHLCGAGDAGFSAALGRERSEGEDAMLRMQYGMLREDDGVYFAEELACMESSAGLVVYLPRCDLEIGRGFPIRSSRALFTAFSEAGAAGVVHTLWTVDESMTGEFAAYMEAEMQRSTDLSRIFHAARRRMKSVHPDVRDWGAYRLIVHQLGE